MRKTYLYQYFATYPGRSIAAEVLFEAMQLVTVGYMQTKLTREQFSQMIADGLTEGWLTVETIGGIDYYSKRDDHE